jgi:hypothetical protein
MKQALEACEAFLLSAGFESSDVYAEVCYAIEQAEKQEPVAWIYKDGTVTNDPDMADGTWQPLFTAPPQREWVGLTDEDIAEVRRGGAHSVSDKDFRAIEAKLKEKNT